MKLASIGVLLLLGISCDPVNVTGGGYTDRSRLNAIRRKNSGTETDGGERSGDGDATEAHSSIDRRERLLEDLRKLSDVFGTTLNDEEIEAMLPELEKLERLTRREAATEGGEDTASLYKGHFAAQEDSRGDTLKDDDQLLIENLLEDLRGMWDARHPSAEEGKAGKGEKHVWSDIDALQGFRRMLQAFTNPELSPDEARAMITDYLGKELPSLLDQHTGLTKENTERLLGDIMPHFEEWRDVFSHLLDGHDSAEL